MEGAVGADGGVAAYEAGYAGTAEYCECGVEVELGNAE
jgi:hypothetical protein